MCLLLLCFGSSGSFITLKEMVRVVAFNLWPRGLQGYKEGMWGVCGVRDRITLSDLSLYYKYSSSSVSYDSPSVSDIVHENLKMGSDGESDQASGTSSDEVQSPTGVCLRNRVHRRISMEVRSVCCARSSTIIQSPPPPLMGGLEGGSSPNGLSTSWYW